MASDVDVKIFIDMSKFAVKLAENETKIAADVAHGRAVQRARVDDGTMRKSIYKKVRGNEAVIGTDIEYAVYQEYGLRITPSRIAPPGVAKSGPGRPYTYNPFLRPAAQTTAQDLRRGKFTPQAARKAIAESRVFE